ncbi:MAG TPA: hypothetical protein VF812_14415 [Ktedonobacterales bacterium]
MWERRITPWLTVRGWRGPETNGRRSGGYEIRFGSEREHDAAPPSLWRRLLYDAALALIWA